MILGFCGRFHSEARHLPSSPAVKPPATPAMLRPFTADDRCRQWVDSVLGKMSLKERIGQLFIYTIAPQQDKANRDLLRRVVQNYKVGGLLFSGGLIQNQVALTNEAQTMADIPLMITFDGEWGLSMRLRGTPVFPRNMVLGCISNDSLLYEYGREMARQCRELGVQVNFAPVADVNINPKNPVINTRSFGESPENVANKVIAYSRGLEDGGVLSVCKHFPGHGDTDVDSHHALPKLSFSRARLDSVELYPFRQAIRAGLSGMMVGHLEVPALEPKPGVPSSLSRKVVHDLLTDEMQFRGLIFTDALAMKGASTNTGICLRALKAGNDLLLVPRRLKEEVEAVLAAVKSGELTEAEIEAKCRKVLTYKYALGLSRKPHIQLSGLDTRLNTGHTRSLIRRLNQAAVVVLKNQKNLLPLDADTRDVAVLHTGEASEIKPFVEELASYMTATDDEPAVIRLKKDLPAAARKQLRDSLSRYKRILVCVTDHRMASYQAFFSEFTPDVPVAYLFFIPGKHLTQFRRNISASDAVLLAHSANDAVQRHVVRILYADATADGRLSASIGNIFPTHAGLTITSKTPPHSIPEEYGMNSRQLARIDAIAKEGIRDGAYPGCQIVILKDGKEMYNKAFGTHTGKGSKPVSPTDIYDLASLTKTTATLLAVMKLYDKGRLSLTDRVSDYLPWLQDTDKKNITVRQLLLHESGLPSTILFYLGAVDKDSYEGTLFKARPDALHTAQIGVRTWANPKFKFGEGLMSKVRTAEHTLQVCDNMWLNRSFRDTCRQKIVSTPLRDRRYRYSCVGFILLQQLVEARTGMSMDAFLEQEFYAPMGLKRTGYLPLRGAATAGTAYADIVSAGHAPVPAEEIVPSSVDKFLRKTTLRGYVHDESAAFLGGVSGNAGLFSNAAEVARIYQMLLNGGELDGKRYLSQETCRVFTTTTSRISRRGLGFDKPDRRNPAKSPCSPSAPAAVYGHTGFTGTCAWVDPTNGMVYVFLCNRIYPNVWNTKLMKMDIRPRIQEAMYEAVKK